ncbi:MAG: hypothetical protein P4L70_06430 [Parasulfuritortus sp.]|nr:hypothetical protein [Parasulfuritortus sp.]
MGMISPLDLSGGDAAQPRKNKMANAIKCIAKYMKRNPEDEDVTVLRDFCSALEQKGVFEIERLFAMKTKAFELSLALLDEWKFDRHVAERRLQKYLDRDED